MNGGYAQVPGGVQLGEVVVPSGTLMVIDFGTLHLWQHDRPPVWPEDADNPDGDGLVDLQLQGNHAEAAGRQLARQWHPYFIYDWAVDDLPELYQAVGALQQQGWDVQLVEAAERVPHRQRVDLALAQGGGGGEIQYFAMTAVAVGGIAPGARLPVVGWPAAPGDSRWNLVTLEVMPAAPVAARELAGHVVVDCARLMFGDADALGWWNHERAADGLADFLFWGLDAPTVAQSMGAPNLGEEGFGWLNLPEQQAVACGQAVEQMRAQHGLKFATDFRPHSHHYQLLAACRSTPTESGILDLGAARLCGFFSAWGDGTFPVYRDLDAAGNLVRVVVDFTTRQ